MRAHEFMRSVAAGVKEGDAAIKPQKPLDAEQWRRRSKRQTDMQQKIRDEESRHAEKLRDLKGRLP
jgi:hypothetical protein